MKKIFKKLLVLPILLGVVACGSSNNSVNNQGTSKPSINIPASGNNSSTNNNGDNNPLEGFYAVNYYYNYEGNTDVFVEQFIEAGKKAVKPNNLPQREGHRFTNWYVEPECTTLFDFENVIIESNTNIYAGWKEVEDPSKGFDITWTEVEGVEYQSVDGTELPTHVDAYTKVSFTINVLATHEGAPVVRANGEQLIPADGVYTFSARGRTTITVTGVVEKEVVPNDPPAVPNQFFVQSNGQVVGEMTVNPSMDTSVLKEYKFSCELVKDDEVVIIDENGKQYKNWENSNGGITANTPIVVTIPGVYEFYLKVYAEKITIWVVVPMDPNLEVSRVYYTNPNRWSQVYCYAWTGNSDAYLGDWPGTPMQRDGVTGYYFIDNIVEGENIIFNNGNGGTGNQTADLKVPTDGSNVFDGTNWFKLGEAPEPESKPEPTGEYYRILFTLPDFGTGQDAAVNPRLHYWGNENTESLNLFQVGAQSNMTLLEGSTYYIDIDTSVKFQGMIILFDQGSAVKQSVDLTPAKGVTLPTEAGTYEIKAADWATGWEVINAGSNIWGFVASIQQVA